MLKLNSHGHYYQGFFFMWRIQVTRLRNYNFKKYIYKQKNTRKFKGRAC